jgi:hypothetical protein
LRQETSSINQPESIHEEEFENELGPIGRRRVDAALCAEWERASVDTQNPLKDV